MPERTTTCPECGVVGLASPEKLPATEFSEEQFVALHQWFRAFDRYSGQGSFPKDIPDPRPGAVVGDYTALDAIHWVIANHRIHSHETYRSLDVSPARRSAGQTERRDRERQLRTSAA